MKYAKHFLPFLALLFTLTLFLSACEQKGDQPTAEPQTYYDVYRPERLALPEGFVYEDHLRSCGNYIYFECRSETEQTGQKQLALFSSDGQCLSVTPKGEIVGENSGFSDFYIYNIAYRADGGYAVYGYEAEDFDQRYLAVFDADGTLLSRAASPVSELCNTCLHYLDSGDIWLCMNIFTDDGNNACAYRFDEALQTCEPYDIPYTETDFLPLDDGKIIYPEERSYISKSYRLFDPAANSTDSYAGYLETPTALAASDVLYAGDACYLIGADGIVRQDGTGNEEKLLDWAHSDLSFLQCQPVGVLADGSFLVLYQDAFLRETYPARLVSAGPVISSQKTELTAAAIGLSKRTRPFAAESIAEFNRSQTEYHITLTDYDALACDNVESGEKINPYGRRIPDPSYEAFERDILNGVRYDFYLFGEYETSVAYSEISGLITYRNYRALMANKGLFAPLPDLTAYGLLPSIEALLPFYDGKTIPLTMHMSTVLTLPETHEAGTPFTMETVYAAEESCADDQLLFSANCISQLSVVAQHTFIDRKTAAAHLDSPDYVKYCQFLLRLSEKNTRYVGTAVGNTLQRDETPAPVFCGTEPNVALQNGNYRYFLMNLENAQDIYALAYLFRDTSYTICGYPSETPNTALFNTDLSFCAGNGENETGAAAYLSFMLSDRVQTAKGISSNSLPVTAAGLSHILKTGYAYFSLSTLHPLPGFTGADSYALFCQEIREDSVPAGERYLYGLGEEVYLDEAFTQKVYGEISGAHLLGAGDDTVSAIVDEEFSYAQQGVRTFEEAAKLIQNRVSIYLSEQQ